MLFNDIVGNLLSLPNCSIVTKNDWGVESFQNLHKTVRLYSQAVSTLTDRSKGSPSDLMKTKLKYILDNYNTLERKRVGYIRKN